MTGKHRRWHLAWALDAPGRTATHDTGLIVRYAPILAMPDPPPEVGGLCKADGRDWLIEPTRESLDAWLAAPPVPAVNVVSRLSRLMREAGDLWSHHHDGR